MNRRCMLQIEVPYGCNDKKRPSNWTARDTRSPLHSSGFGVVVSGTVTYPRSGPLPSMQLQPHRQHQRRLPRMREGHRIETPAITAGLKEHVWALEELVGPID
ncbi:MAG TPA: hypothetical protein VIM11_03730 [Tepidisphaeraceae bacterium]